MEVQASIEHQTLQKMETIEAMNDESPVDVGSEYVCKVCGDAATIYRQIDDLKMKMKKSFFSQDFMELHQCAIPVEYSSEEL